MAPQDRLYAPGFVLWFIAIALVGVGFPHTEIIDSIGMAGLMLLFLGVVLGVWRSGRNGSQNAAGGITRQRPRHTASADDGANTTAPAVTNQPDCPPLDLGVDTIDDYRRD